MLLHCAAQELWSALAPHQVVRVQVCANVPAVLHDVAARRNLQDADVHLGHTDLGQAMASVHMGRQLAGEDKGFGELEWLHADGVCIDPPAAFFK